MENTLPKKSFVTGKLLTVSCLGIALLFSAPGISKGQALVTFGVEFGTPQSNGGPCISRGGCEQVYDFDAATGQYASSQTAVTVTFTTPNVTIYTPPTPVNATDTVTTGVANIDSIVPVNPPTATVNNTNVLIMTFSMNELENKRPDQVAYFTDPSNTYQFDAPYSLTDPIFAPLGLLPGAYVDPTDETNVTINGDVVALTIYYSYDASKMSGTSLPVTQTIAKCTLSPNPATNVLMITPTDATINHYCITNLVGQAVNSDAISSTGKTVDVSNLPSGMYLVNLFAGNNRIETMKFVKQ